MTIVSDLDAWATAAAAWVVTFTIHGFIVCLVALVCGRFFFRRAASRDLLWKGALVLPFATSFLTTSPLAISPQTVPLADFVRRASPVSVRPPRVVVTVMQRAGEVHRERRVRDAAASSLAAFILAAAFANAIIGVVRHRRRRRDLMRELAVSWPTSVAPDIEATLAEGLRGVRLVAGAHLLSPIALGHRTVCVPAVSFPTLNHIQQTGVLAHEVAHLERLDPYWIGFAEFLAAVVPFSYALRFVVVNMRRDSELLCDAAAARVSRSRQSLVEALAVFVGDLEAVQRTSLRIGYADSPVLQRARRLLHGPLEPRRPNSSVWAVLIVIAVLAAISPRASITSTLGPPGGKETVWRTAGDFERRAQHRMRPKAGGVGYRRQPALTTGRAPFRISTAARRGDTCGNACSARELSGRCSDCTRGQRYAHQQRRPRGTPAAARSRWRQGVRTFAAGTSERAIGSSRSPYAPLAMRRAAP